MLHFSLLILLPLVGYAIDEDEDYCKRLREGTPGYEADAHLIEPGLWLGNVCALLDHVFLEENDITHAINVAAEWSFLCEGRFSVNMRCFPLNDTTDQSIDDVNFTLGVASHMLTIWRRNNQTVLVHCNAGISRSSAVVIMYMMTRDPTLQYDAALKLVRKSRAMARPNHLFESLMNNKSEKKKRHRMRFSL